MEEAVIKSLITKELARFLKQDHPIIPILYILPKIHKSLVKPPGRPIISSRGSLLQPISQYIDFFLQPIVQHTASYIKDTTDFLNKLQAFDGKFERLLMVTLDVSSLYTCIQHKAGLQAIHNTIVSSNVYEGPNIDFLLTLTEFVLNKNYSQMLRATKITSDHCKLQATLIEMGQRFVQRGYCQNEIDKAIIG